MDTDYGATDNPDFACCIHYELYASPRTWDHAASRSHPHRRFARSGRSQHGGFEEQTHIVVTRDPVSRVTTYELAFAIVDLMGTSTEYASQFVEGLRFGFSFLVNEGSGSQAGWVSARRLDPSTCAHRAHPACAARWRHSRLRVSARRRRATTPTPSSTAGTAGRRSRPRRASWSSPRRRAGCATATARHAMRSAMARAARTA